MAETEKSEQPQSNGLENGLDEDERTKLRPADIDADVREMERRKRVEMIMGSKLFREELERIIELQMKDGNGPAGLLQQISDMMGIQSGKLHTTHMWRGTNCVTPINDIRGVESMGYEKGEKNLRCKLASVFRLMDLYGWSQGISNQITARLNQDEEHFLVNPHGMLFNEITASSLIKCDMQGNIVESGTTNFTVLTQGFLLHSAIHASRPDVNCVIHIRTPSVLAVSSLKCGLLPLSQESLVIGEVSQHPFLCGIFEPEEREKIIRNLGPSNKVLLLYNNGAICCGATVEEAFYNAYNTVLACETQVKLMPIGVENLVLVNDETRKQVYDAAHRAPDVVASGDKKAKQFRVGEMEFEALIRMLDNAGFRTGYIYRHPLVKGELPKPKNDVEVPPAVSSLGYLIEQEELYKQGNWKKYVDGRNRLDRTKWLNSPNVYQKVEILETGTSDPKKITKWVDQNSEEWVAESSPTHSSTPVKIESALQFVPKGTNPKEFKKLQQQIKENRRADKITSGPQSHILEGVSWEEAKKLQDANITHTGDQVILVGAASKGIIQRNYQHNALVYKTPYAKNPFDSMSDKEIEDYKQLVEKKQRGDTDYEESQSESEAISSSRQDALRHFKSPLLSPQSATSETEEESRDEPRVLRIETKTAPRPIQAEVVLSDAESDSTDARVERSHSARYPKAEKPESVTLMNSFRKSWSLKREKDKSKDIDNPEAYDTRNLHPSFILSECERDRMESLHCCVARITQLTHKPVIVDLGSKALRPLLKSASDPCNLSTFYGEDVENPQPGIAKDFNTSLSCNNIAYMSDLKRRLNIRKKLLYSAKMKFLGLHDGETHAGAEEQEKASTSPMCALISEIRETINEIMSPERSKNSGESTGDYFSSMRWIERPKFVPGRSNEANGIDGEQLKSRISLNKSFQNATGDEFDSVIEVKAFEPESLSDFRKDFQVLPSELDPIGSEPVSKTLNCTCVIQEKNPEKVSEDSKTRPKVDENQNEEREVENVVAEVVKMVNISDEEATYTITDDSLLQTYSFTETTETEWYYNKTIMTLENSQTVMEIKNAENKENLEMSAVKYIDTGIDTDFTSEKENDEKPTGKEETEKDEKPTGKEETEKDEKPTGKEEIEKEEEQPGTIEDVDADVPVCESLALNKSSETDSSFLKSGSGKTSSDVDTSFAFKTETENSEKINEKIQSPASERSFEEKRKFLDGMLGKTKAVGEESSDAEHTGETKTPECEESSKLKFEGSLSKLPGIPESPEFTNVDTEDAPVTSSSKDTSPDMAGVGERLNEDDPLETTKEPEIESEKEKERAKPEHKRKKSVKSSTKITVKKELKEQNCDEPIVSEIKLTIKNSKPCQSEKYEVKIQDVTNTSEELSRSVSSAGENVENYESFEIVDNDCGCEAQQNLEDLQGEVSSTIEKLQSIENYFEDEIKKHSNDNLWESEKVQKSPEKFTIEYNYSEFEGVLNESEGKTGASNTWDFREAPEEAFEEAPFLPAKADEGDGSEFPSRVSEVELQGSCSTDENVLYFVSDILGDICGEVEVGGDPEEEVEVVFGATELSENSTTEMIEEGEVERLEGVLVQRGRDFPKAGDEKEEETKTNEIFLKSTEAGPENIEDFEMETKVEIERKISEESIRQTKIMTKGNSSSENSEKVLKKARGKKESLGGVNFEDVEAISQNRDVDTVAEEFGKESETKAIEELSSSEINTEREDEDKPEVVFETVTGSETVENEIIEEEGNKIVEEKIKPVADAGVEVSGRNVSLIEEIRTEDEGRITTESIARVDEDASEEETFAVGNAAAMEPEISDEIPRESMNEEQDQSDYRQEVADVIEQYILRIIDGLGSTEPEEAKSRFEITEAPDRLVKYDCKDHHRNVAEATDANLITAAEPEDGSKVLQLLRFFRNRFYPPLKAITWKEPSEDGRGKSLSLQAIAGEPMDYVLNRLFNSVAKEDKGKLESVNNVINFILTNEESPADSLTEFEDMENMVSASDSVVADLLDSVESRLEGDVESLPDEEEMRDKDESGIQKRCKSNPIFKVTITTPTKKEIFINYSVDSSSSFDISSESEASAQLCNSYIYADDVNDDYENLSSDNPDFFSVGSPAKISLDSSFGSAASGPDPFCCTDCENHATVKSPRSLAIIQEVDEGDNNVSSELAAPSRPDE